MNAVAAPADPFEDLFAVIDKMTVIELVSFVKTFEGRFGVSATPAAQQVLAPEVTEQVVEEQTEFDVVLTEFGQTKIPVIKAVREVTGLGLKEAKDLVDSAPAVIKTGVDKTEAERVKTVLTEVGATVEVR